MEKITSFYRSDQRYLSLRIISAICTLSGIVLIVIGILLLVFGLSTLLSGTPAAPPPGADGFTARPASAVPFGAGLGGTFVLLWSFLFLLFGLQSLAQGAFFQLAIQLEENTRASAQSLDKIRMRLESGGDAVEPFFRA